MQFKKTLASIATLGALALSSTMAMAEETIKIGLIAPFSGTFADYGSQIEGGIKAYMKQHGDKVVGKKIEVIVKDTTGPVATWAVKNGIRKVVTLVADYGPGIDAETTFKTFFAGGGQVMESIRA